MASPPNEYRTLRTINTLLISGAGFSIAAKTRKKYEDKREEKIQERRIKTRKKKEVEKEETRDLDSYR